MVSRRLRHRWKRPVVYAALAVITAVVLVVLIVGGIQKQRRSAHLRRTEHPITVDFPATTAPPVFTGRLPGGRVTVVWPTARPLRVLFVGDSITQGRITTSPSRDYVSLVTTTLQRHGTVAATVDWKSGAPVEYWMNQPYPTDLDLVIVESGTNEKSVPEPQFANDYAKLVAKIHRASPRAKMVCVSMWRPDQTINAFAPLNRDILYGCDGGYADVTEAAHEPANISPVDKFHPNNAGHGAIAKAVLGALQIR